MKIQFIRSVEIYLKGKINQLKINKHDFSIISNNCWGTFIYKKYGLPYQSPFVNLFIFADDYLKLLENFSPELINNLKFIERSDSKYQKELNEDPNLTKYYPIGLLGEDIELHFLHYKSEVDALEKWTKRAKKINYDRLIFKFSDGDNCTIEHIRRFDALPFLHKVCFTSQEYVHYKSVIFIKNFEMESRVRDEWKHFHKYYNLEKMINSIK